MTKKRIRGRAYTVYPKKQKSGVMYYVEFRGPDGKFGTAKSTGQRTKGAAETWANAYLNSGQIVSREKVTFKSFAEDFFDVDGSYAQNKQARGSNFSKRRLKEQSSKVTNWLIPAFGKMKLTDIDYEKIAAFQIDMLKAGKAGDTVNGVTACLSEILKDAYKKKLIHAMPIIERVAINAVPRGVLSAEEVATIFKTDWGGFENVFLNSYSLEARTGNLLAAATGLRQGEIVALRRCSVQSAYISVDHSWDNIYHKLKAPKTEKSKRFVPIPSKVHEALEAIMKKSTWIEPEDFLFQGERRDRPMNPEILRDSLYEMLLKIGIDDEQRESRQITFHSWRHWFNSLMVNNKIPTLKVQSLTGHTTDAMTANYYHPDQYQDVLAIQEEMFS